jgi:hypothetical protein
VAGATSPPIILNKPVAAESNSDKWVIVKNLSAKTCAVLATQPNDKNLATVTTFKSYMMGDKATKDMVVKQCGCESGCDFELPR